MRAALGSSAGASSKGWPSIPLGALVSSRPMSTSSPGCRRLASYLGAGSAFFSAWGAGAAGSAFFSGTGSVLGAAGSGAFYGAGEEGSSSSPGTS